MANYKKKVIVSISYFDFDFGSDLLAADTFASVARQTITDDPRSVEIHVTYVPIGEEEQEDKEEEQTDDQTTD